MHGNCTRPDHSIWWNRDSDDDWQWHLVQMSSDLQSLLETTQSRHSWPVLITVILTKGRGNLPQPHMSPPRHPQPMTQHHHCSNKQRQSTITTINCTDSIQYLGLFINHKLNWHKYVKIMATRACGTLKSMKLLSNSVKGLNHGSWHLTYCDNAICLSVLTYSSPIWFKQQKQLLKIL